MIRLPRSASTRMAAPHSPTGDATDLARRESVGHLSKPKKAQPERELHKTVAEYLDWALPDGAFWFAIPNAANFDFKRAKTLKKYREITPGMTDLGLVYKGKFIGIELKAGKNDTTENQDAVHVRLTLAGALLVVVRSVEQLDGFLRCIMTLKAKPQ